MHALLLFAASLSAPVDAPTQVEPVVSVASRSAQPAREVAGTVSLIERERLDQWLVRDLADAVRYEAGVSAPEDAARFGSQGLAIRGLSGNRVGMLLDGVPLAESFAIGSFSNASRGVIEPGFLARLELLRGPASTLYGSDALAGVLSARTLSVGDLIGQLADNYGGRADTTALSRDGSTAWTGVSGVRLGNWQLLAGLHRHSGRERDNRPRPGGLASNPAERSGHAELLKLGWEQGAGHVQLQLDRNHDQADTEIDSLEHGPGQYATTSAMVGDDDYTRQRLSLQAQWDYALPGLDQLSAVLYQQHSRTLQRTLQTREAVAPRTPATLRDRSFLYNDRSLGLAMHAEGRFDALGARHWQTYGVELSRGRLDELRDAVETNLSTGAATQLIIGERFPVRDFPDSDTRELAAWWQDEIRPGDAALTLIPGVRYEHYRVDARVDSIFRADNPALTPVDLGSAQFTPKLGLRYELSHATQLYAQYAVGFRAPPVSDVNIGFTIPAFNYVAIPNPGLRPEHSRGLELGARYNGEWLSLDGVVYDNRYRDLIDSRVNLGRNASGALVFQSINRARAHIVGAELRSEAALPWSGYSLNAALAWSRGDDTARDVPLNSVDPASLTLGLAYESASGRQRLELVSRAVAAQTRIDTSTITPFRTPGYATLDLYWQVQLADQVALDLALTNLGNRRYWQWSSVRGLPADAREVDLYTQPGRQIGASLRYRF